MGGDIQAIAARLASVAGQKFNVEEVAQIDGQAGRVAACLSKMTVQVTSDLSRGLTVDELAWLISHEAAHLMLRHQPTANEQQHRDQEREADEQGFQLATRAGFHVKEAIQKFARDRCPGVRH